MEYPKDRVGSVYALRYIKWLCDAGIAMEIGPDAFALLVAVVSREDSIGYSRAPNFFNDQLATRAGIGSEPALIRARKRAVDAGLLAYKRGAKRRPGVYFVSGFTNESFANAERIRSESDANRLPSIPIPNPIPKEKRPLFVKPTLGDVKAYCVERRNAVNPEHFLDYYEANGWMQGKNKPIRDWKAAVRTWEQNSFNKAKTTKPAATSAGAVTTATVPPHILERQQRQQTREARKTEALS